MLRVPQFSLPRDPPSVRLGQAQSTEEPGLHTPFDQVEQEGQEQGR